MYKTHSIFQCTFELFLTFQLFLSFLPLKNAVLNISVQVLVGVSASASFDKYLEMIARLYDNSVFRFLRSSHTDFHSG